MRRATPTVGCILFIFYEMKRVGQMPGLAAPSPFLGLSWMVRSLSNTDQTPGRLNGDDGLKLGGVSAAQRAGRLRRWRGRKELPPD